jgi:chitinase
VTEDGVEIPGPDIDPITVCETTPSAPASAWDADKVYQSGDLVFVDGQIFEAQWYAHGTVPGEAYGPWSALTACGVDPAEVQEWHASTIYQAGDRVLFDGETYTASWWTRGEAPGASQWGPWKK